MSYGDDSDKKLNIKQGGFGFPTAWCDLRGN